MAILVVADTTFPFFLDKILRLRLPMSIHHLRSCLFCGGESRRMGCDKALLPHPNGGVWLTALINELLKLSLPLTVVSRHQAHKQLLNNNENLSFLQEPPPWNGPLHALSRVLSSQQGQPLLVLPVDMPRLTVVVLQELIEAWRNYPDQAAVAHDGQRLQPMLAVIPSAAPFQPLLMEQLGCGELRWQDWLPKVPYQQVALPPDALLNANRPEDLAAWSA